MKKVKMNIFLQKTTRGGTPILRFSPPPLPPTSGFAPKPFRLVAGRTTRRALRSLEHLIEYATFTKRDSTKDCSWCGEPNERRWTTTGPHTLNLVNPESPLRIIQPRTLQTESAGLKGWLCKHFAAARWLLQTPSYSEAGGWYHIKPEVQCTDEGCDHSGWGVAPGRDGYRKFSRIRWATIRFQAWMWPEVYVLNIKKR